MKPAAPGTAPSPARWPLFLALGLLAGALAMLVWLRGRLVHEERTTLADAVRVFERGNVLLRPENDAIRFSLVESSAQSFEESEQVESLFVTKRTLNDRETLVYPFWYELTVPEWRTQVASWERLAIGPEDNPTGWLYIRLAKGGRTAVDRTIFLFVALLVTGLSVLVFRQRGQEIELSRTATELERRRNEVIRLERLALAGQLSANVFHDIKKPVLNIKHEAGDLLDSDKLPTEARGAVAAMQEQTDLFLRMLRDLGFEQFVRAEGSEGEYCDVRESLERAVSLVRYEQADVELEWQAAEAVAVPLIFAPPHRLIQLFSNLILNAYQAMNGKGRLVLKLRRLGDGAEVAIEDNGPGVAAEIRARLFEPFASTKQETEGSGLGLYICREILMDLGGTIRMEDVAPRGTRFVVWLPAARDSR